jgi:Na+-driven multidrug efflux pump
MSVLSSRTQRILEAPVLPLLLSLAAPNIGEAAARITFLTADAVFVSWLGSDALAGVAVVFPLFLILQTATASGFGSGVSSAIGRALGAGDHGRAASLAGVAVAIALIGGALTTALMLATGPALYAAMGLSGRPVEMAVLYGGVMFGGSVLVWLMNLLANVSRGAGNMMVPAFAIAIGEAFHLALSPALILGWGPFPALGIVGAALAAVIAYGVGTIVLVVHLVSRQALVRLRLGAIRLRRQEAAAILGVGVVSAASATLFQVRPSWSPESSPCWAARPSPPTARPCAWSCCSIPSPLPSARPSSPWWQRPPARATSHERNAPPGRELL